VIAGVRPHVPHDEDYFIPELRGTHTGNPRLSSRGNRIRADVLSRIDG
jgi:hypothetical protein